VNNATKVGIFSVITIVIFFLGFQFLKGSNIFVTKNKYYAIYDKVDQLYPSNQIVINGYKIGIVGPMEYQASSGKILVQFIVDDDIPIPVNSTATIASTDLLGGKVVKITLGNATKYLESGDTMISEYQSDFTTEIANTLSPVVDKAGKVMAELEITLKSINRVFKPGNPASIEESLTHLNQSLASVQKITYEFEKLAQSGTIQNSMKNVESITNNLKNNNQNLDRMLSNFAAISDTLRGADIGGAVASAKLAITNLQHIMGEIEKGNGSIGKLIKDEGLYNHLDSAVVSLDVVLKDLKKNPYRYVNVSVFGGKKRDERYLEKQAKKEAKAKK
jgi:phospholipid/cholesterol/gamma-HCH transport system substrate-binding protein